MAHKIVNIPGTILKELRISMNMSLSVAAKKIKIEEEELIEWEENGTIVSVSKARDLSNIYKRHWTILLLDKIPEKKDLPKAYRKLKLFTSNYTTDTLLAFRNAERILALAEMIDGRKTNLEGINIHTVSTNSDIEETSNSIRHWLDVTIDSQISWKDEYQALRTWKSKIESKGIYVAEVKMNIDEARAFALSDNERTVIILNSSDTVTGRIFSLIHELGHILLNKQQTFDVFENMSFLNDTDIEEYFCNKLAGTLLVPKASLEDYMILEFELNEYISKKASQHKVSRYVLLRRLYDLKKIHRNTYLEFARELEDQYEKLRSESSKSKWRPSKDYHQTKWIKRNSTALVKDTFEAYRERSISYGEVANLLNIKLNYLPKIEYLLEKNG